MKISRAWKISFFILYTLVFSQLLLSYIVCDYTPEGGGCWVFPDLHALSCILFLLLLLAQWLAFVLKPKLLSLQESDLTPLSIVRFALLSITFISIASSIFLPKEFPYWARILTIGILLLGNILQMITFNLTFKPSASLPCQKIGSRIIRLLSLAKLGGAICVEGFCFGSALIMLFYYGAPVEEFLKVGFSLLLFALFVLLLILNMIFENSLLSKIKRNLT